jgi:hypothetical protein
MLKFSKLEILVEDIVLFEAKYAYKINFEFFILVE